MARLIVKSPYIRCGNGGRNAGGYLRYIGTRERVELLPDDRPPTRRQEQLITAAVESHWDAMQQSDVYMKYIATRPRAERLGSHGLFDDEDSVDLGTATDELEHYEGNVWTHIISLKREDATRLGYDNAKAWRDLLRAHRNEIAEAMHIPPNDFRWYAAFHNEGRHPHVHMMAWSVKPGQAYLNRDGIRQIRSQLTNDVFQHEMLQLYEQKSASRDALVREARRALMELTREMRRGVADCPELESLAEGGDADAQLLLGRLYRDGGMLIPDAVNAAYWLDRAARQDVTAAQYALGKLLLAPDVETHDAETGLQWLERAAQSGHSYAAYRLGKEHLTGTNTEKDVEKALDWLTQSTKAGNPFAQYALGKLYLDGTLVQRDVALGMAYMKRSARQGNAYAQLFIDRRDSLKPTSVMLAATRLLHQAASVFRENALPKTGAMQPAISRKRMQKLIEQKGYKAAVNYAREREAEQQYSGMSMAMPW